MTTTTFKPYSKYAQRVSISIAKEPGGIERVSVCTSADMYIFFKAIHQLLGNDLQEHFYVAYLNRANKIVGYTLASIGGLTGTVADPRIILQGALACGAVNIGLCHNHPSGSLTPSRADELLTDKIKNAAQYLDIKVLDHIIISEEGYYSFADEGLL